ncbi:TPA: signal recognition particle-docking protein FtsY [Candidatus Woesearchaeota archaeon]|nr:signal recognition particle-docking protein FtsY [Candidatus Woesearchaeota archaeon]HIH32515.1 signal recognition particle-docking protein FtsY [Candidatus Woesearchaeota archaeon]HIH54149.1 signal recognition particle-docking protein FtsY [Candidatus Woesearchaeota archaeon]HIJ01698.1 signal recognition particle-docking protein FtsY [Candidatus Woesearchaeota archaeon]HIJ13262.1 signal recognition particle-docking protein FtsY [Candidatus Woesearchaeota archaeon]
MFGFLKDKLKKAVGKFTKEVEKESVVEEKIIEKREEKRGFFQKIFGKKDREDIIEEKEELLEELEKHEEIAEEKPKVKIHEKKPELHKEPEIKIQAPKIEVKEEAKIETKKEVLEEAVAEKIGHPYLEEKEGFFSKITETFTKFNLSEERFEELFWELEVVMLENNVAVEVIEKIKNDMKKELMSGKINRKGVEELILKRLKDSIVELFDIEKIDLMHELKKKKPYIIAVIGVNGSGKTTSIAKLTSMFQKKNLKVVLAASDTFRAAAIQQLEEHATRLNTKLIKHDYNSDPAAVAFDAIKYAEAKQMDVVIIDTAGRLHSNTNLMEELKKVVRVCKPDIKIFVGESITGNDCVEQAKEFDKAVGIDAIILAKADVDEKGGAAISVSYVTQKPIIYLGTGQTYDDLKEFDSRLIIESLEL